MSPKPYINTKQTGKKGQVTVYIMVHIEYKSMKFNTGVSCNAANWDEKTLRIKGNSKDTKDDNLVIEQCMARLNDIAVRYRLQNIHLSAELLKNEWKNPARRIDFYKFFDEIIAERKGELAHNTVKSHKSAITIFKIFKPTLSFAEITPDFIDSLQRWLKTKHGNDTNTVHTKMRILRNYLNVAVRKGIITENPFSSVKIKKTTTTRVFLTSVELNILWELYISGKLLPAKQKILRHFLFMCFTGLRISDMKLLTKTSIIADMLVFNVKKTKNTKRDMVKVPLNSYATRLIADENSLTKYLFNTITEQKMNVYIKEIASAAGIHKAVTNHSGRHTFATCWLKKTKDLAQLQVLLGHSNIAETMIYVHVDDEMLRGEMKNFDALIFSDIKKSSPDEPEELS
jgi:integrase/recombinase XerD